MKQLILHIAFIVVGVFIVAYGVYAVTLTAGFVRDWITLIAIGAATTAIGACRLYRIVADFQEAAEGINVAVEQTHIDPTLVGLPRAELWTRVLGQFNVTARPDDEHEGRLLFDFQGGHFYVDIDDSAFAELYYAFIEEVDLTDIDEVSLVRRAINEANYSGCPNIVYSLNDEEDRMYVHMVQSVLLVPQIPHLSDYLQSRLVVFFQLQRRFVNILDKLRKE